MSTEEKLRDCPFCGKPPERGDSVTYWEVSNADFGCGSGTSTMSSPYFYIRSCGIEMTESFNGREQSSMDEASARLAKRWNTRAETKEEERAEVRCPICRTWNRDNWPVNVNGQIVDGGCQECWEKGK